MSKNTFTEPFFFFFTDVRFVMCVQRMEAQQFEECLLVCRVVNLREWRLLRQLRVRGAVR